MKAFTLCGYVLVVCLVVKSIEANMTDAEKSAITNKMIPIGLQCMKDHPLTITEMKAFKNKMVPDGKNPKCFTACMFKKMGVMDDKGMLSPAQTRKNAEIIFKGNDEHLKNVEEIMELCSSVNHEATTDGNKGCDRAKLAFNCLMENAPKYGFDLEF